MGNSHSKFASLARGLRCAVPAAVMLCSTFWSAWSTAEESTRAAEQKPVSIAALHADIKFSVLASPRLDAASEETPTGRLERQARRISVSLEDAARGLHPDAMRRVGTFNVYVAEGSAIETRSSSTGKIALSAGLSSLQPSDDWLAFVLAREMGHVLAGHHESNSTASIVTSILMNLLIPGSSLVKSALSLAGSEVAASSGGETQVREADEIAARLLETAGYNLRGVALNLTLGPKDEQLGTGSWSQTFRKSAQAVIVKMRPAAPPEAQPRPASPSTEIAAAPQPVTPARISEEPLVRARPSGVPGSLLLGGYSVPARRLE